MTERFTLDPTADEQTLLREIVGFYHRTLKTHENHASDNRWLPPEMKRDLYAYLDWLQVHEYSPHTVRQRRYVILFFITWADERGITRPDEVRAELVESYQRWMFHFRQENGKPLTAKARICRLSALRAWYGWLRRQKKIVVDPTLDIEFPREERRLPRNILTQSEVEQLLAQPDVKTPLGLRDRAMLETLYSTAMRRAELAQLRLQDLDTERGLIMIRCGKGKRDRMVPIGRRALDWVRAYLDNVRPELLIDPRETALFLTPQGGPMAPQSLSDMVRRYVAESGIRKRGGCHMFRHATAPLMLENGADIRYVQALLGHADLRTTQIYTHVTINQLRKVHEQTHPARPERAKSPEESADDDSGE
jgi:integrase/recombinase XerD